MSKKKDKPKNKKETEKKWEKAIEHRRAESPEHVDWELCADAVQGLQLWVEELCIENHNLKQLLKDTVLRLEQGNEETKKILKELKIES